MLDKIVNGVNLLTRWLVWIVLRESHLCFEVASIVEGVGVQDHQGKIPMVDVIFIDLAELVDVSTRWEAIVLTHIDLYPFLFDQSLVLLHEHGLRHDGLVE